MSALLIQNSAGRLVFFLETTGGTAARDLTVTDVQVDLKKSTAAFFTNKVLTAPTNATASVGSGIDGTVTVAVPGAAGNIYTVEVTVPGGTSGLEVTKAGAVLEVALSVSGGVPVGSENTASLIAAAINDLDSEIQATASGTGASSLSIAEGPTTFTGGVSGNFTELGAGFYELGLSTTDTNTLGTLFVRIQGPTITSTVESATVAVAVSPSPTPTLIVPITDIFGYLVNVDGSPMIGASIGVKVLSVPTVVHPGTEGFAIGTSLLTTTTDDNGFFTIDLVTGSDVDLFIPAISYRRTFTVPSSSENLFDIP